jgi:hypothetical protein
MQDATPDYEKLGAFYLGRRYDPLRGAAVDEPILYDSRNLTTHGVCVAMTGSGKTGLCLALLEEAAIDGIPAIAIDPKGDLGNLLLAFPELAARDFRPWVDEGEAARAGRTPDQHAEHIAASWRAGLAETGQDAARIARYCAAVERVIYTPGSQAGRGLSIVRSLAAPAPSVREDEELLRERVAAAVAGLLGLLGIEADPLQSREHILLARLVEHAWLQGRDLELETLVREILEPPFERVGVLDLGTFFPLNERKALALRLNNLLASSAFASWLRGEPIDVQRLLWTAEGKPRLAIVSIAHLSEQERMFFVTLLLNEIVAWVRAQPGTASLRALLYMDEVYGYFPPVANPPSKGPMLTLLKQARAHGLGVVLATQNPIDLDYRGLANAGTWWLGRLQTERDQARVLDGLEGAAAAGGRSFERARMQELLASLPKRVFLQHSVHESEPTLLATRWVLSYLRGPLTRADIQRLMHPAPIAGAELQTTVAPGTAGSAGPANSAQQPSATLPQAPTPPDARAALAPAPNAPNAPNPSSGPSTAKPLVPPEIDELFLAPHAAPATGRGAYVPRLYAQVRLRHADAKSRIDHWRSLELLAPCAPAGLANPWSEAEELAPGALALEPAARAGCVFGELPASALRAKSYAVWEKALKSELQRLAPLRLWRAPELALCSRPEESEGEFRARVALAAREERDRVRDELERRYAPKLERLRARALRAAQRVEREQSQYGQRKLESGISIGASLLGALFGRKAASAANVGRAASAARGVGRARREQAEVESARQQEERERAALAELEAELAADLRELATTRASAAIEPFELPPRKSDVLIERSGLAWLLV